MAEAEQTPQPEGQEGENDVPYREYLERIPEQYRGEVQPVLDDWNNHINGRLQEAAEFRKAYEPYDQAGVRNVDPQELQGWMQFRQAAMENPQAIAEWYQQYAAQNGLEPQFDPNQFDPNQDPNQFDPNQGYEEPDVNALLQQQLSPLQQQLEQMSGWIQQQDMQTRTHAAMEYVEGQLQDLQDKHGDQFNRDWVEKFIPNYIESDPQNAVNRAFEDYQKLVGGVEKQLVNSKGNQPQAALSGGMAATQAEQPANLKDASALMLEQLKAMNRQ